MATVDDEMEDLWLPPQLPRNKHGKDLTNHVTVKGMDKDDIFQAADVSNEKKRMRVCGQIQHEPILLRGLQVNQEQQARRESPDSKRTQPKWRTTRNGSFSKTRDT